MRNEIGVTMRTWMQGLKPGQVAITITGTDCVFSSKRRIADDCIKAWLSAQKYLWELDWPMKWA